MQDDQQGTHGYLDFGISRLVPKDESLVSTVVQGTHGYLDPEYLQTGYLTEKSDVYSFGVVLVEILTGKKVLAYDKPETERFLSNFFLYSLKQNHLVEIIDLNISGHQNMEQIAGVATIAEKCINVKGADRPYMKDVARELEALAIKAQKFHAHSFEIDSRESEYAFLGAKPNEYERNDDTASSDLYPVPSLSTTQHILLPISGGR